MHACGFTHEQNREERDQFVQIVSENIKVDYESNFEKASAGTTCKSYFTDLMDSTQNFFF